MSKTTKALMVIGLAAFVAACAQKQPAPAPADTTMVAPEPTSGKM